MPTQADLKAEKGRSMPMKPIGFSARRGEGPTNHDETQQIETYRNKTKQYLQLRRVGLPHRQALASMAVRPAKGDNNGDKKNDQGERT